MEQNNRGNGNGGGENPLSGKKFEVRVPEAAKELSELPIDDDIDIAVPFSEHEPFSPEANQRATEIMEVVNEARRGGGGGEVYDKIDQILNRKELTSDSGAMYKTIKALNN